MLDLKGFIYRGAYPKTRHEKISAPPMISIITPSYNQGRFLEANILSVIRQGYPDYEHIIIDGGSSDNSVKIIKSFGNRIAYWVSEPDKGQSHALNKGLAVATGDIIGWQNSDDLYLPDAFWRAAAGFRRSPVTDVLFGDYLYIDEEDNIISSKRYPPMFDINEYIYVGANISNQAAFFKRSALEKAGGFNEEFHRAMDFDIFLRLSSFAGIKHMRAYLGGYRIHKSQKGQQPDAETEREYIQIRRHAGVSIKEAVPWKRQYRGRRFYYRTRRNIMRFFYILSYLRDPIYKSIT